MLNKIRIGDDHINHRLLATVLVLLALTSGTALAGWGDTQSNAASLPALGAQIPGGQEATQYLAQADPGAQNYGANMATVPMMADTSATAMATYAQQAPPASERQTLLNYNAAAGQTQSVYYSGTYVPWNNFIGSYPGNYPLFWAASQTGWSWYTTLPLGTWVQELMFIPMAGNIKVYEIYPTGMTQATDFGFAAAGYKYLWFNGDTAGRHITIFTVGGVPSNAVTIDVGGYQSQGYQSQGYPSQGYQQQGYPSQGYPSQVVTGQVPANIPVEYATGSSSENTVLETHYSEI